VISEEEESAVTEHALIVNGVSRRFGKIQALDDVSFSVKPQSFFGLLGPNGAGKTTLFSIAANFIQADAGSIEVLGVDVRQISRLQGRFTILPQDARFQRNVPILEQLVFFRLLDGKTRHDAEAEVKRTLEMVGLGEYMNRRVHSLSHGMINRLGVAQAFLGDPEVILLDEPTSGLDPANAKQIRDLIREFQTTTTVLISSHNLAEIQDLCDHVAILDEGCLVTAGSVEEITRAGRKLEMHLSRPLEPNESAELSNLRGVMDVTGNGTGQVTISLDLTGVAAPESGDKASDTVVAALLQSLLDMGITPREFHEGSTLEEHFLQVTGKSNSEG